MKRKYILLGCLLVVIGIFAILWGCRSKHAENAANDEVQTSQTDDHEGEFTGATFEEGKGIRILDETKKSIDLELLAVSAKSTVFNIVVSAQIYRLANEPSGTRGERQGNAYATALISAEDISRVRARQEIKDVANGEVVGSIWKIELMQVPSLGKAELLLALPDAKQQLKIGDFIKLSIPVDEAKLAISVPKNALLETSQGSYLFVKDGDYFQRRAVKTGSQNSETIEITEGLKSGDIIVVKPVDILHLIELKATKGGGHGH